MVVVALIPWFLITGGAVFAISVLSVHYRDMRDLVGHLLNLLFFSSPIIYSLEGLQVPVLLHRVLILNPMASLVTVYRDAVFAGRVSPPQLWLTAFVVGGVCVVAGDADFYGVPGDRGGGGVKGAIRFVERQQGLPVEGIAISARDHQGRHSFTAGSTRRKSSREQYVALDGIDLEVTTGEAVALIGPNGSGKSTLLKLIGGILKPTSGTVEVAGRVTALIEVGAGFHPEITGRENVVINGMLLGLGRREIEDRMQEIVDFADIGPFIDQPVKIYSSGMYVRLGFAVAVATDPDILLIDEVLAVGDEAFTRRCLDRLARMRQRGVTMVLVSHDLDLVTSFADRALYLDRGRIVNRGPGRCGGRTLSQ